MACAATWSTAGMPQILEACAILSELGNNRLLELIEKDIQNFDGLR